MYAAKERKQWPGEYINRRIPCQKEESQGRKPYGKAGTYITREQKADFCGTEYVILNGLKAGSFKRTRFFKAIIRYLCYLFLRHGRQGYMRRERPGQ